MIYIHCCAHWHEERGNNIGTPVTSYPTYNQNGLTFLKFQNLGKSNVIALIDEERAVLVGNRED